jgi:YVTN family beta-propeller protein
LPPSDEWELSPAFVVRSNDLQPKSIVATGTGLLLAQNMMYRHNVMVFTSEGSEVTRIDDSVDLAEFGVGTGVVRGAPVEAAVHPNGAHAYVSNYKMYGTGWNPTASDDCNRGRWDDSFVYRIDLVSLRIDEVMPVGAVPKFLAVSPDGRWLVVSNWCSFDVSIIDLESGEQRRVDVGRHPRGIAISPDSQVAYVTVMGSGRIDRIDIATGTKVSLDQAGPGPRHVVLSPDGEVLYVTNNLSGEVRMMDASTGEVRKRVRVGEQPRTMAMAADGASLYVVLYREDAVVKLRADDLAVVARRPTGSRPVGVTVDPVTNRVWVADYAGSLTVFDDVPR